MTALAKAAMFTQTDAENKTVMLRDDDLLADTSDFCLPPPFCLFVPSYPPALLAAKQRTVISLLP